MKKPSLKKLPLKEIPYKRIPYKKCIAITLLLVCAYFLGGGISMLVHAHSKDTIKEEEGSCMIVCHGGTVQSIMTHLLDLQVLDRWHFHVPLAGIVEISYTQGYGMLKTLTSAAR